MKNILITTLLKQIKGKQMGIIDVNKLYLLISKMDSMKEFSVDDLLVLWKYENRGKV